MAAPSEPIVSHYNGHTYSSIIIDGNVVETLLISPDYGRDDSGEFITRRVLNVQEKISANIGDLERRIRDYEGEQAQLAEEDVDYAPHTGDHND